MLETICIKAIEPAAAKLPDIKYEIKNVAPEPVNRQLAVLTKLRKGRSVTLDPFLYVFW